MTVTIPSRAKVAPSYTASAPQPNFRLPPWIQTSTGIPAPPGSGVHTFRFRQSSPSGGLRSRSIRAFSTSSGSCGWQGPNRVASSTPSHGRRRSGGRNRSRPTGGSAYGIPRNTAMPSSVVPRTLPCVVSTIGLMVGAGGAARCSVMDDSFGE